MLVVVDIDALCCWALVWYRHLDDDLIEEIGAAIEKPAHVRAAIASLGVSHGAFYEWLRKGTIAPHSIFGKLRSRVQLAEANREIELTEIVMQGARKDAKWGAWLLEKLYPERWGPYAMPANEGDTIEQLHLDDEAALEGLTDEQLEALAAAAEILERVGQSADVEAIPADAREASADPVHRVHIPGLPPALASPPGSDET